MAKLTQDVKIGESGELPIAVKYLTTISVFFGCFTFGCAFFFFPPVLVELKNKYGTDTETVSRIFVIMTITYLFGAVSGGLLYGKVIQRQHATFCAFLGMSSTLFITPYCSTLVQLFITAGFLGFSCGAYDTAQVVWLIEIWQSKSGPFLQAQNFFFALGTTIPSLLTKPFLSHHPDHPYVNVTDEFNSTNFYEVNVDLTSNRLTLPEDDGIPVENIRLRIPFMIAAAIALCNAMFELFLISCYKYRKPRWEREDPVSVGADGKVITNGEGLNLAETSADKKLKSNAKWHQIKLVTISVLFIGFYVGGEMCYLQFLSTLAQYGDLKLSEAQGAFVLTGFTGAFAIGRALGIIITFKVSSQVILCVNLLFVLVGNTLLLFFANSYIEMLWVGSILLGLGFSTMYASFYAMIERYINFTDFIGSLLIVAGSVVAIVYPMIVGRFIEDNPIVLTYTNYLSMGVCAGAILAIYWVADMGKNNGKK